MRVLIAARLSQLANGQTGLDTQDIQSSAWAEANGHTIVAVVADRKSGTSAPWDRPNLKPWVREPSKLVQYDAVLAYRLDRLTRGDNESTNAIEQWARENGKTLLTEDALRFPCEGVDGIRWDLTKRLAHEEWLKTSERYARMRSYLVGEGKLVGRPPFGYAVVDAEGGHKTLTPTDLGREYVPAIFERVLAKDSLATIALWLDAEGVPTAGGGNWTANSVGKLIRCTTLMGRRQDASGRTIMRCEALVDPATFRRAGEALADRPHRGPMRNENKALLTGVMKCFRCGGPMYRTESGDAKKAYYRCAGTGAVRHSDCRNMIAVDVADAIVHAQMAADQSPVMTTRIVRGHDNKAALEEIRQEMRDLPLRDLDDEAHDLEMKRLRAQRDLVAEQDEVADELVYVPTGETYAELWAGLTDAGRNLWMRSAGVHIWGLHGDDAEVLAVAERTAGPLFWEEEDGQAVQHTEIPPSIDGNWVYIEPPKRRMHSVPPRT